jgi:hypothetical protein
METQFAHELVSPFFVVNVRKKDNKPLLDLMISVRKWAIDLVSNENSNIKNAVDFQKKASTSSK